MKTTTCPDPNELRQLLDGSLSEQRQQECTEHLDACECCQAKLEEVAIQGTSLSQVCRRLANAEPEATSAYWPAFKALDAETPRGGTPRAGVRSREVALDFLAPATDAAYLGRLGQFDVMRIIGRGGMGVVLEAFDSRLHRHVAIKVLDPDLADDPIARQRFCREARAAASIAHANVVAVHQVEKSAEGGLPYMVMQLVSGETLEDRLQRQSPLPVSEIVRIGMQAAQGLEAAHAQGLMHRDIKPGNILLESPHDRVKLTDFGLARGLNDLKLTQSGFVSGTPLYMAPEQVMGEEADHRSDLFSLGAVLYEMATGHPPFSGDSAVLVLRQVVEEKHRPVRELNPLIPDWMAMTIDRLLAKKPGDRIQSAAQLAELFVYEWALTKASSDEMPTVCEQEIKKRKTRARLFAGGVGAMFLALGLFGGTFFSKKISAPVEAVSSAEPVHVLRAKKAGTVWSVAFNPTSDSLAMAVENGTLRLVDLQSEDVTATFNAHRGIIWASQFAHNGDWFATAGDDGLVKIWSPLQPNPIRVFTNPNAIRSLALSHDDRKLFVGGREGTLRVWSVDADASAEATSDDKQAQTSSPEPLMLAQEEKAIYAVAISPDDEILAVARNDGIVRLFNANSLTHRLDLDGHSGPVNGLSFNHDGRRLASVGWNKEVRVWDTRSGQVVRSWDGHDGDVWSVVYSPDGSKLATGGLDGAVKLWNAETGELLATFLGHKQAIHSLAFNRDGTLLASGARDGAARVWKIE